MVLCQVASGCISLHEISTGMYAPFVKEKVVGYVTFFAEIGNVIFILY
jgi:hypothetical protein